MDANTHPHTHPSRASAFSEAMANEPIPEAFLTVYRPRKGTPEGPSGGTDSTPALKAFLANGTIKRTHLLSAAGSSLLKPLYQILSYADYIEDTRNHHKHIYPKVILDILSLSRSIYARLDINNTIEEPLSNPYLWPFINHARALLKQVPSIAFLKVYLQEEDTPPAEEDAKALYFQSAMSASRATQYQRRLHASFIHLIQEQGWYPIFDTLTYREDVYREVFDHGTTHVRQYIRNISYDVGRAVYGSA